MQRFVLSEHIGVEGGCRDVDGCGVSVQSIVVIVVVVVVVV